MSLPAVEPKFSKDNPEAAVRDGAEELTLRRGEEGGLRTLMDTTNEGFDGEEWDMLCQKCVHAEQPSQGNDLVDVKRSKGE